MFYSIIPNQPLLLHFNKLLQPRSYVWRSKLWFHARTLGRTIWAA